MRLVNIPDTTIETIEKRVPDAKKILSYEAIDRSKFFPISSLVFRSDKPPSTSKNEVYWLTWDPRNLGRSTQQLSLALSSLESNQTIVLTKLKSDKSHVINIYIYICNYTYIYIEIDRYRYILVWTGALHARGLFV